MGSPREPNYKILRQLTLLSEVPEQVLEIAPFCLQVGSQLQLPASAANKLESTPRTYATAG